MAGPIVSATQQPSSIEQAQQLAPFQGKKKGSNDKLDLQGFLTILTTKLTHQDPFSGNSEPMDVMADMAQMMLVQNSSAQLTATNKMLEEIQSIKSGKVQESMGDAQHQAAILSRLEGIEAKLSAIQTSAQCPPPGKAAEVAASVASGIDHALPAMKALDRFLGL